VSLITEIANSDPSKEFVLTGEQKREFVMAYLERNFFAGFFDGYALADAKAIIVGPLNGKVSRGTVFAKAMGREWAFEPGEPPEDDPRRMWDSVYVR